MNIVILSHKFNQVVYKQNDNIRYFKLYDCKDGHILKKKTAYAHKLTLKELIMEEKKKRRKLIYDKTYDPSDKDTFINNLDVWRIRCYNHIGVY